MTTIENDAEMVKELHDKAHRYRTEENRKAWKEAEGWFMKKHKSFWKDWVPEKGQVKQ